MNAKIYILLILPLLVGAVNAERWQKCNDHSLKGVGNNPKLEDIFVRLPLKFFPLNDEERQKVIKNKKYLVYVPKVNRKNPPKMLVWQADDKSLAISLESPHRVGNTWHMRLYIHEDPKKQPRSIMVAGNDEGWMYIEAGKTKK